MNIFITGGTGFVGRALTARLLERGHRLTILTRSSGHAPLPPGASYLEGDPTKEGAWQNAVARHDAVINLAGASIFRRWTDESKRLMRDSRILTTKHIVKAIEMGRPAGPTRLLSASAVGYYGFHGDEDLDERSPRGEGFLADLAAEWESAALAAEKTGVRVALTRFGVVLGEGGGALEKMVPLFKGWLGSPLGTGRQWFSWIHRQDLTDALAFLLDHDEISGPVNCTAPEPIRNREMTHILGDVLGKPTFMPSVPGFALRALLGEFGSMLLEGQKVLPKTLLDAGFAFRFPKMREALGDLLTP